MSSVVWAQVAVCTNDICLLMMMLGQVVLG